MTRLSRSGLALAATTALVGSVLTGCGGDDASGAPDDASREDFCTAFLDEPDGYDSDDPDEAVEAARDYADKLREVGTPDVPDEAREGFELYVDFLTDLEAEDAKDLQDSEPSDIFDEDELAKFEAFSKVTADCGPGEF